MAELVLGALAGAGASALFSAGLVLQALEARAAPEDHTRRLALVRTLLRRPRWVLGGLAMIAGFGFHVSALLLAPLTVVQPSLAAGLLVLLAAGTRLERAPVGPREVTGVVALTLGLVALTLTSPERTT